MLSLAGDAPLPATPGGPAGVALEDLPPLLAWFKGSFQIAMPTSEVNDSSIHLRQDLFVDFHFGVPDHVILLHKSPPSSS